MDGQGHLSPALTASTCPQFTGNGPCEMSSVQKSEQDKSLDHSKKRSRPSLLRPVSAPAKVTVLVLSVSDRSVRHSPGCRPALKLTVSRTLRSRLPLSGRPHSLSHSTV
jgi:hypothetical protein